MPTRLTLDRRPTDEDVEKAVITFGSTELLEYEDRLVICTTRMGKLQLTSWAAQHLDNPDGALIDEGDQILMAVVVYGNRYAMITIPETGGFHA